MRTVKMSGERLIQSGKTVDANGNELNVGDEYIVKFIDGNIMAALTQEQWDIRHTYSFTMRVYEAGGILNLDITKEFDARVNITKLLMLHINNFNKVEDYEKSQYLYEELQKLKTHNK